MIVIYTRNEPRCSYCEQAKAFLDNKKIPFTNIVIGQDITREEVLATFPQAKTLPIITIGGVYIGGYNELVKYSEFPTSPEPDLED